MSPFVGVEIANQRAGPHHEPPRAAFALQSRDNTNRAGREDEPAIREVLAHLLQDEDYAVRLALDGLEATDELEADDVDLVLSNVWMPRLDGPSLARRLRRHGPAVPVVPKSAVDVGVDLPGVRLLRNLLDRAGLLQAIGSALGPNR